MVCCDEVSIFIYEEKMMRAMQNAKGLSKTSSSTRTPVVTRGCAPVMKNIVLEDNVENNIGYMSQTTMSCRVLSMVEKHTTLMNERI